MSDAVKTIKYVSVRLATDKRTRAEMELSSPDKIYRYLIDKYGDMAREMVLALFFDTRLSVTAITELAMGDTDNCTVPIKTLMQTALLSNANGIVLAHNHPTGVLKPSHDDIVLTERVKKAAEIMSIQLHDHIIFSRTDYYSMRDKNSNCILGKVAE